MKEDTEEEGRVIIRKGTKEEGRLIVRGGNEEAGCVNRACQNTK